MSMFSMLISLFTIIFWIIRVATAFTASMGMEFILEPLNLNAEIILTFITLACIILIFKRKLIGALIYLISHIGYFGVYLYNWLMNTGDVVVFDYVNVLVSILGVLLPLIIFIDVAMSQSAKKTTSATKKTDWYYQNDEYNREYDERADRNQYKF